MLNKTVGLALAAVLIGTPALAEGRPFSWTGLYIGANVGGAWSQDRSDVVGLDFTPGPAPDVGNLPPKGWFLGGQIGYNFQQDNVVFGIEGDIQFGDVSASFGPNTVGTVTASGHSEINMFGTMRARLGFAADRALFYLTGGLALANVDYRVAGTRGATPFTIQDTSIYLGYVVGAGMELALTGNWSAKLEYQYLNWGKEELTGVAGAGTVTTYATPEVHSIRLGLNYRFGDAPVHHSYK